MCRAAEFVHKTLWPKPKSTPIREMTEEELFGAAYKLKGEIGAIKLSGTGDSRFYPVFRQFYCDPKIGTRDSCDTMLGTQRRALRMLARACGKLDEDTDTITV